MAERELDLAGVMIADVPFETQQWYHRVQTVLCETANQLGMNFVRATNTFAGLDLAFRVPADVDVNALMHAAREEVDGEPGLSIHHVGEGTGPAAVEARIVIKQQMQPSGWRMFWRNYGHVVWALVLALLLWSLYERVATATPWLKRLF